MAHTLLPYHINTILSTVYILVYLNLNLLNIYTGHHLIYYIDINSNIINAYKVMLLKLFHCLTQLSKANYTT